MSDYDVHRGENPRVLFFLWIVLGRIHLLIIGLGWRQLIAKDEFDEIEKRQVERRILKPGPRGDIYDREGRLLVGNRPHYSAVVYLDDLRPEFRKEYSRIIRAERKPESAKEYEQHRSGSAPSDPPTPELQRIAVGRSPECRAALC